MHSRLSGQGRRFGIIVVVAIWCIVLLPAASVKGGPEPGAGVMATSSKTVSGHVYLGDGVTPAASAVVIATVWNLTTIEATLFTTTDSSGLYTVTFAPSDWNVGNIIIVGASAGGDAGQGTATADSSGSQTIDITLNLAVPEFGLPEVIVAGMVVVMFAAVGRRAVR